MRFSFACGLCALLLVVGTARPASAQSATTGRIEGTIYDDMGMPMAGASVVIASPTQIGGPKRAITDGEGGFRFLNLIPGVFSVTVSKKGFISKVDKVRVNINQTATLDILLDRAPAAAHPKPGAPAKPGAPTKPGEGQPPAPPPPEAETYVIKAARPAVDVTKASTGETISDEFMQNMPVLGRSYQGAVGLTGQVTQRRNPKGNGAGNPSISGGTYFNNTYLVDGMETSDPVTQTFGANFNYDAMANVQVINGGKGAEWSNTPGGVINIVTKSGSNDFQLDLSTYYQDSALTIQRPEDKGRTFSNLSVNLNAGGPIIRDKLWYYTSFQLSRNLSTIPADPNGVLPQHPTRKYLAFYLLGKVTYQLNPRHKLVFWAQSDPALIDNTRQLLTVEPDAEGHQNQFGAIGTIAHEWLPRDDIFVKSQVGFKWGGLRIFPQSGNQQIPRIEDLGAGLKLRNFDLIQRDDRFRLRVQSKATYFVKNRLGDHEIKLGMRFDHLFASRDQRYAGDQLVQTQFGQPLALKRYFLKFDDGSACDPASPKYDAKKCQQGTLSTTVDGNKYIAFLEDTWRLPHYKRLRVIPGMALHFGDAVNPDGSTVTSFFTATPHLNAAWDLFGDGRTVIRGGYNQYVDMGFLAMARFIGPAQIAQTCNYDPNTQTYTQRCRIAGAQRTVGVAQPEFDANGKVVDKFRPSSLTPPRTHELTFGAEREWLRGFSSGFDFQYRYYANQWEDLETNLIWNELGTNTVGSRSGKSEVIFDLETPSQAHRRYIGLTFFARKFIGNWQVMASYTWSRFEGTVAEGFATVYLDRARQAQFANGYLPDDRRHVFKLNGFYRWRNILTVSPSLWVGTGTPYDKLFFNNFFNDYEDRRSQRGTDPKDLSTSKDDAPLRLPTRVVLNLKVVYHLAHLTRLLIGERHNLELIGEIFNLLNTSTPTNIEERNLAPGAPTQFGTVLDRQSVFRVRFGLRYRY